MKRILLLSLLLGIGSQVSAADEQQLDSLLKSLSYDNVQQVIDILNNAPREIINQSNRSGLTPLGAALSVGMAEMLIMRGADVDGSEGRSPFLGECAVGKIAIAKLLLQHKATVDLTDIDGNTALHYAKDRGRPDIVGLLLQHKASVNIPNKWGDTPLAEGIRCNGSKEDQKRITAMLEQAQEYPDHNPKEHFNSQSAEF